MFLNDLFRVHSSIRPSLLVLVAYLAWLCLFALPAHAQEPSEESTAADIRNRISAGYVMPSLYYSRSQGPTIALAYVVEEEDASRDDMIEPFVQLEWGIRATYLRTGIFAYSPIGASYSLSASILKMTTDKSDELFHRNGSYAGAEISVMFGLAVARLGYYRALENEKKTADSALNLTVGIGLF